MLKRKATSREIEALRRENQSLRDQLAESQEMLRAIRDGEVDALVVSGKEGDHIYTLQSAEQPYRVLIERMSEGALTLVQDGTIQYANRAFADMLGRPLEQVMGTAVKEYVAEGERALFDSLMRECLGGSARGELSLLAADGRLVPAYLGLSMLVAGGVSSICMVITDLTEQKRSAEVLASERFSRAILNQASDGIVVCDASGRVTFVNAMARRLAKLDAADGAELRIGPQLWGYAQDGAGRPLAPRDWPLTQALRGHPSVGREIRTVRGDVAHDLLVNANPLREADGSIIGAVATFTDITQRKAAAQALQEQNQQLQAATEELRATEEELRSQNDQMVVAQGELVAERHRYASLFEFAPDAYLSTDREGAIQEANRAAQKLLNASAKALIGTPLALYVAEDARDDFEAKLAELRKSGQRLEGQWMFRPRRRPAFPAAVSVAAIAEGPGEPGGLRWLIRDITEQKKVAAAMEAARHSAESAKAEAERATQAKDHFLAVLSHELRTPLSPVLGTVSLLQEHKSLDAEAREHLEMIRRNVELEARLIDDLLDVTRIVRGKVELNKQSVQLCTILQQAVEVCQPDIEARRLEFGVDLGSEPPYFIEGDPSRLQQVFWNLLKNAIKFTPEGGCVGIRCRSDGDGHVIAEVNDSGIGIEASVLPRLFNPFEQGERSTTRQFGGLGLGLTISKAMVELHGGTIEVRSAGRGKGATFAVRLPRIPAPLPAKTAGAGAARTAAEAAPRKLAILLVEDHGDTARIMAQLLVRQGHMVEAAGDVATALRLAGQRSFDLLLSDLGLPDGSGLDLMRALRAKGINLPGIALSGYGQENDIRQSREAGFVTHLIKPVSLPKLREAMGKLLDARPQGTPAKGSKQA